MYPVFALIINTCRIATAISMLDKAEWMDMTSKVNPDAQVCREQLTLTAHIQYEEM